jgi:hypothetical protein
MLASMKRHVVALQCLSVTKDPDAAFASQTPFASPISQSHSSPRSVSTTPLPHTHRAVSRNKHENVGSCVESDLALQSLNFPPYAKGRFVSSVVELDITNPALAQLDEFPTPSTSIPSCFPKWCATTNADSKIKSDASYLV